MPRDGPRFRQDFRWYYILISSAQRRLLDIAAHSSRDGALGHRAATPLHIGNLRRRFIYYSPQFIAAAPMMNDISFYFDERLLNAAARRFSSLRATLFSALRHSHYSGSRLLQSSTPTNDARIDCFFSNEPRRNFRHVQTTDASVRAPALRAGDEVNISKRDERCRKNEYAASRQLPIRIERSSRCFTMIFALRADDATSRLVSFTRGQITESPGLLNIAGMA